MNAGLTTVFDIPVGQRNLQISAEYYYTRFFESMLMDLDCTTGVVSLFNLTDIPGAQAFSHTAQIEASMEVLRGWTITAAFRYNDVRQTSLYQSGAGVPSHRSSIGSSMSPRSSTDPDVCRTVWSAPHGSCRERI